ncbi:MAG TPA: hypothetical protein VEC35_03385 [Noviherbaspirillum sp.]|nr:hypothetical protein [Noviherbaspirillum sp.]
MAQPDAATAVPTRYPSGSIRSVAEADAALAIAAIERAEIEARYAAEEQACHPKFFATSCIDQAKERRRKAMSLIRPVEIEANTFKRRARLDSREQALAERLAKEEKERQERTSKVQAQEPVAPQQDVSPSENAPPESPENAKENVSSDRSAKHEAKLKLKQVEDAANAEKRAENIAAYEKKKREALERQQKVAERKAEKEKKRREKQGISSTE